ncbi:MAG: outer membrane protein assembly factor BamB [Betaproteobacteria bacterium]|nr:outer membrane protein assembly factor BamB [Betaproteobacteria bacterium]
MSARRLFVVLAAAGLVSACSTLDSLNPFSSSGPKPAPLPPIQGGAELRTLWSTSVGKAGDHAFKPAIVGNAVFAAGADGNLSKLVDGKTEWSVKVGQPISAGVGASSRLVVVGTAKGDVLAFAADDGRALWKARVTSEVLAAPTVGDGIVAVRSGDHRIFLFDAGDGGRKWVYQRATPSLAVRTAAPPVIADRFVFAGFPGGKLVAIAQQNGASVWEGQVASPKGATELDRVADIASVPAIDGRQICAVAFQGRVACFDMGQGGALMWARDISSAAGLTIDGNQVFVTDDKGAVHALERNSGSSLWKQDKLGNRRVSAPAANRGAVAVADGEGYLHVMSRDDGRFVARQKIDSSPVRTPVQAAGSGFLVQTAGGTVTLIEAR